MAMSCKQSLLFRTATHISKDVGKPQGNVMQERVKCRLLFRPTTEQYIY
jgi:hypothetical protein